MRWFLDPVIHHYADFKGRSTRKEYWMFVLMYVVLVLGVTVLMTISTFSDSLEVIGTIVSLLFAILLLGTFIPALAILVRRLHDIGWSGWWCLLNFIPYIGGLILIILCCIPSQKGTNKYGENKYGVSSDSIPQQSSEVVSQQNSAPVA